MKQHAEHTITNLVKKIIELTKDGKEIVENSCRQRGKMFYFTAESDPVAEVPQPEVVVEKEPTVALSDFESEPEPVKPKTKAKPKSRSKYNGGD